MDKENVVCNGILFSLKKRKKILQFATTWINLGDMMRGETNQLKEDKCFMILLVSGIYKSQTYRSREKIGGCQGLG